MNEAKKWQVKTSYINEETKNQIRIINDIIEVKVCNNKTKQIMKADFIFIKLIQEINLIIKIWFIATLPEIM